MKGAKGKPEAKTFEDILLALKDSPAFKANRYISRAYHPYFKVAPVGIFNEFEGWIHEFQDEKIRDDDPDIARVNAHLFDLAGRNHTSSEYLQKWHA